MNNLPRQVLRQILAKYGKEICSDARRCENLLKDLCGSYGREINVLVNAIEERVPLDLLAANRSMPLELLLMRIEKRLEEQTALTAEASRWAVESWALALNLATESEIQARQKQNASAAPSVSKIQTVQPEDSADKIPNGNRSNPVQPPKIPTGSRQQRTSPPVVRQPTRIPLPPPAYLPTGNQSPAQVPRTNPQQQTSQVVVSKSRFGIFRGCLVIVFLLAITSVVLLLGVPYAIEVMRQTQQERNNEPPRFPVR